MQIPFNSKSFVRKTTISYYAIVSSSFNKEGEKTEYHWDILFVINYVKKGDDNVLPCWKFTWTIKWIRIMTEKDKLNHKKC